MRKRYLNGFVIKLALSSREHTSVSTFQLLYNDCICTMTVFNDCIYFYVFNLLDETEGNLKLLINVDVVYFFDAITR